MDNILYLYGTGRAVETRTERRGAYPREQQVRIGQWIIRPTRRVAVRREDLAKHLVELRTKATNGTVQLQLQDGTPVALEDYDSIFNGSKPDYSTLSQGELFEILRGESPTVEALRALMLSTPIEERREAAKGLTDVVKALQEKEPKALMAFSVELENAQREYEDALKYMERDRLNKEAAEAEARAKAEKDEADAKAAAEAAEAAKNAPPVTPPAVDAPKVDDADDMDFSKKDPAQQAMDEVRGPEFAAKLVADGKVDLGSETSSEPVAVTETVKEQLSEIATAIESTAPPATTETPAPVVETAEKPETLPAPPSTDEASSDETSSETPEQAAAADAQKVEGRDLPEGWRALSNPKMLELITQVGAKIPDKKNKDQLTKALETWLAGGS